MFEWVEKPLGELATFVMGQSPDSATVTTEERGLPFLQGCAEFGAVCPEAVVRVDPPLKIAPEGSTLISVRAPVGTMNQADQDYGIGRGLAAIVGAAHSRSFLQAAVQQNVGWLHRRSQGSTFLAIGSDDLKNLPILVPHNPQIAEKAAQVLNLIDTQIESMEALIAKQERLRAGLMQDLFTRGVDENGELRPPREEAPHLYYETELGYLPKGWKVDRVTRCQASSSDSVIGPFGSNLVAADYRVSGTPVIFVRDLKPNRFTWKSDVFLDDGKAVELNAHKSQAGDVLATKMGFPPCVAAVHPEDFPPAIITADMIRLRVSNHSSAIPSFVAALLNSEMVQAQVRGITGGVTRPKVTLADFRSLRIPFPLIEEQARLMAMIGEAGRLIDEEAERLAKLRLHKVGLMQDLLTGTVSVEPLLEKEPA